MPIRCMQSNLGGIDAMLQDIALDRYLCAILILGEEIDEVRSVDVADWLGCTKTSVSVTLKELIEKSLVERADRGRLVLTPTGACRAAVYRRYFRQFERLLICAGMNEADAKQDSFAIVRALSVHSRENLCRYLEDMESPENGRTINGWRRKK